MEKARAGERRDRSGEGGDDVLLAEKLGEKESGPFPGAPLELRSLCRDRRKNASLCSLFCSSLAFAITNYRSDISMLKSDV